MKASPELRVWYTEYHFRAVDPIAFPAGTAGNRLRGAFGRILKTRYPEEYERIFAPRGSGPSGIADAPRPFIFQVSQLDGKTFPAGSDFACRVCLFEAEGESQALFQNILVEMGAEGIGPERARAEFLSARPHKLSFSLEPDDPPVTGVQVSFLTPTELKSGGGIAPRPEFPILFRRIRDRISVLSALYGSGPLQIDFRGLGLRAEQIRLTRCDVSRINAERRSGSTGQVHPIGGFIGEVEYRGDLGEFVPYLEAAQWTGVGRQTVWGKGEIQIHMPGNPKIIEGLYGLPDTTPARLL